VAWAHWPGAAPTDGPHRLDETMEQRVQAEQLTSLGELVSGVTLELDYPLLSILGYAQLSLREDLPPQLRRHLETVCAETQRVARIVRNLLKLARKHLQRDDAWVLTGLIKKNLELKAY